MKKKIINKKTIITSSLPYVNNRLHLGHIYSTFLPADIHTKTLQMFSKEVSYISGHDVFGYNMLLESLKRKISINKLKNIFKREHEVSLKYFNISFTNFSSTDNQKHTEIVNEITNELIEKKLIYKDKQIFFYCKNHNIYLINNNKTNINNLCEFCEKKKIKPNLKKETIPILKLIIKKDKLNKFQEKTKFNKVAKNEIEKILTDEQNFSFLDKVITRPFNYGVKIDESINIKDVYYVWYEALISYISFSGQKEWNNSEEIIQYMGKDNVFFHSVLLPNIYIKNKIPNKICAGSFLLYKDDKFSKTHNVGIFCQEIINKKIPSDAIRFVLSFLYREKDTNISLEEIYDITNNILISKILNTFQRFLNLLHKFRIVVQTDNIDDKFGYLYTEQILSFFNLINQEQNFYSAINIVIKMSDDINKYIDENEIWKKIDFQILSNIFFSLSCLSKLLSIYCPKTGKQIKRYFFKEEFKFTEDQNRKTIFFQIKKSMKKYLKVNDSVFLMKKLDINN